jgi:hypothetical protein
VFDYGAGDDKDMHGENVGGGGSVRISWCHAALGAIDYQEIDTARAFVCDSSEKETAGAACPGGAAS